MPVMNCTKDGKKGKKWGESGFCYTGPNAEQKAIEQGQAIEANKNKGINSAMDKKLSYRNATVEVGNVGEDNNPNIRVAFSSDEPVLVYDYARGEPVYEVLGHNSGEIDLGFIGSGRAPVLLDHNRDSDSHIGVVDKVEVDGGRARALLRFSNSPKGQLVRDDVMSGIKSNVSVGYIVNKSEEIGERDGYKVIRAINWSPKEISLVAIPADESVGVGRSETTTLNKKDKKMTEEVKNKAPEIDIEAVKREATQAESKRVSAILSTGNAHNMQQAAAEFIERGKSADDFRRFTLEELAKKAAEKPVEDNVPAITSRTDANIGMSEKELKKYSIRRAILASAFPQDKQFVRDAGFEMEVSEAAEKNLATAKRGSFVVPNDVLMEGRLSKRDLVIGQDGSPLVNDAGYYTKATDTMSMIELLRNRMFTQQAGATVLSGLVGDVSFPRHDTAATIYYVSEGVDVTESTQAIGQVLMQPKTAGVLNEYSRKLLIQSSIDVENFVRNDQAAVLARGVDGGALAGSGTAGQPTGVLNQSGVGTSTIGSGSPANVWADVVNLWTDVATANADQGSLGYISAVNVAAYLKTAKKDAGSGDYVYAGGQIDGYPVYVTNQQTTSKIVYGNWAELLIGIWGGLDVLVDPYTKSASGGVRIVSFISYDVAVRHAGSFSIGTLA